jgi:RNA polymerase sigma-70 factor (ECF subfamily)
VADLTRDADEGVNAQVESLLRAHGGDVEGILRGMGFPPDVAQSAVHDALLAAGRLRKKGTEIRIPKAFLVKVAIFQARNILRKQRSGEVVDSELVSDMPGEVDDSTVAVMIQMDVRRGLGQLSQRQREAVTLCDLGGFSYQEAAERMGISPAGVESSRRRGRERLKEIMLEQGYQPRKNSQPKKGGDR